MTSDIKLKMLAFKLSDEISSTSFKMSHSIYKLVRRHVIIRREEEKQYKKKKHTLYSQESNTVNIKVPHSFGKDYNLFKRDKNSFFFLIKF